MFRFPKRLNKGAAKQLHRLLNAFNHRECLRLLFCLRELLLGLWFLSRGLAFAALVVVSHPAKPQRQEALA